MTEQEKTGSSDIVVIEAPPTSGEKRFLIALLRALGANGYEGRGDNDSRISTLIQLANSSGKKMLIVDETHNVLTGLVHTQETLNLLKFLYNNIDMSIVLVGTERAKEVITSDQVGEMKWRFPCSELPAFTAVTLEFREILRLAESFIPLANPSYLCSDGIAKKLNRALSRKTGCGFFIASRRWGHGGRHNRKNHSRVAQAGFR